MNAALRVPTPIFVVGMNRSGTKWLCNILCSHPAITGIQTARHAGILETNLFGRMQALVGDIDRLDHYVAFVELWSQTDFFKAAGIDKAFFYERSERPTSMLAAFRLLMDEFARRAGCAHWLQKCSPIDSAFALPGFPDARVVTIQRELVPTLESTLALTRLRGDRKGVARAAAVYAYEAKRIAALRSSHGAVHVAYEDLCRQPEIEIRRVCETLRLDYRSELLEPRYRSNSSFGARERETLGSFDRWLAALVARAVARAPMPVLRAIRASLRSRRAVLVPGTFAEIVERYQLR